MTTPRPPWLNQDGTGEAIRQRINPAPNHRRAPQRHPMQILPATVPWAHPDMATDYNTGADVWREVSESFHDEMLNCLPPIYLAGGWAVSEPHNHDRHGRAVFCCFVHTGGRYFARLSSRHDFPQHRAALMRAVIVGSAHGPEHESIGNFPVRGCATCERCANAQARMVAAAIDGDPGEAGESDALRQN